MKIQALNPAKGYASVHWHVGISEVICALIRSSYGRACIHACTHPHTCPHDHPHSPSSTCDQTPTHTNHPAKGPISHSVTVSSGVQLKGKAAIDVVCNPLGKSGGSAIQQVMIICFGSLASSTPYLGAILLGIVLVWLKAAGSLDKQVSHHCFINFKRSPTYRVCRERARILLDFFLNKCLGAGARPRCCELLKSFTKQDCLSVFGLTWQNGVR